jgi:hypothetical protein
VRDAIVPTVELGRAPVAGPRRDARTFVVIYPQFVLTIVLSSSTGLPFGTFLLSVEPEPWVDPLIARDPRPIYNAKYGRRCWIDPIKLTPRATLAIYTNSGGRPGWGVGVIPVVGHRVGERQFPSRGWAGARCTERRVSPAVPSPLIGGDPRASLLDLSCTPLCAAWGLAP